MIYCHKTRWKRKMTSSWTSWKPETQVRLTSLIFSTVVWAIAVLILLVRCKPYTFAICRMYPLRSLPQVSMLPHASSLAPSFPGGRGAQKNSRLESRSEQQWAIPPPTHPLQTTTSMSISERYRFLCHSSV